MRLHLSWCPLLCCVLEGSWQLGTAVLMMLRLDSDLRWVQSGQVWFGLVLLVAMLWIPCRGLQPEESCTADSPGVHGTLPMPLHLQRQASTWRACVEGAPGASAPTTAQLISYGADSTRRARVTHSSCCPVHRLLQGPGTGTGT